MNLRGYNYISNATDDRTGFARVSSVIETARATATTGVCVLFDNGDALQGTPLADTLRHDPDDHPLAATFNALNYDAIGLGNHDFDFGLDYFNRVAAQYNAPVLSTNLRDAGLNMVLPWVILDRVMPCEDGQNRALRIGVLSVLPPQTLQWNYRQFPKTTKIDPMIKAAENGSAHLKSLGADVVVLLAHTGIGSPTNADVSENAALRLGAINDIDAIIAGHTHDVFPHPNAAQTDAVDPVLGTLSGTPAAMPGFAGSHLAQIDLTLAYRDKRWNILRHSSAALTAESAPENTPIRALSQVKHGKTLARMSSGIGLIDAPIHSCFSLLKSSTELDLLADAMHRTIRHAAIGTAYENLPVLSAVAPGASGGRAGPSNFVAIPAGPIQYRHVVQMCPFEDEVWAVEATGADIYEWLERSAAIYETFDPAQPDQNVVLNGAPRFNFDVICNLSYSIDPTQPARYASNGDVINPAATRIHDVMHNGAPLEQTARFLVAATSYRIAGGGRFPRLSAQNTALRSGVMVQDAVLAFIKKPRPRIPKGNWRIKTAARCRAVFETSPLAEPFFHEIANYRPENLGLADNGFLRVRLNF